MSKSTEPARAPPALKLIHAAVFLGFCGLAIAGASPELQQLRFALAGPFHAGTPPFWPAVLGAAAAAGGALALLLRLLQRREVSLFVSLSILGGFLVALTVNLSQPEQRLIAAANLALLEVARALQREMGQRLQQTAAVADDEATWAQALSKALEVKAELASPLRDRAFRHLGWKVVRVAADDWVGEGAAPGTIGAWVSDDRATFTVTPIGLSDEGAPAVLRDDAQRPIRLRGVFNPDITPGLGN